MGILQKVKREQMFLGRITGKTVRADLGHLMRYSINVWGDHNQLNTKGLDATAYMRYDSYF